MFMLGLLVVFGFVITGVPAPGTKMCYSCHNTADNNNCHVKGRCHPESLCGTEVRTDHHGSHFYIGCIERHLCEHDQVLVGKRQSGHHTKCRQCCDGAFCNVGQCNAFAHHVTAKPTTAPLPATAAPVDECVDYESASFQCSLLGNKNFCHDTTDASHYLAYTNCRKYCGHCPTTTTATTTARPCVNDERNGFNCSDYDIFGFCTDTSSFAHPLAVEKCRAHCGYCTKAGTDVPTSTIALPANTDVVANTDLPTATTGLPVNQHSDTTTATILQPSHAPTHSHVRPCSDDESSSFRCADYDVVNFCTDTQSPAHKLALEKCPAHCHFCTPPDASTVIHRDTTTIRSTTTRPIQTTTTTVRPSTTTTTTTARLIVTTTTTTARPILTTTTATARPTVTLLATASTARPTATTATTTYTTTTDTADTTTTDPGTTVII